MTLSVWDADTGERLKTLHTGAGFPYCVTFSPDGSYLASVSPYDKAIRLWNASTGEELGVLRGHDDVVNITIGIPCVRTSPGHGTAFDIAGKYPASEKSMVKATLECVRIAKRLRHAG